MNGKQADLQARLHRLEKEAGLAEFDSSLPQDALRLQMAALLKKAESEEAFLKRLRIAVAVEHLNRIRLEIDRRDTLGSNLLAFASGAAADGYRTGLRLLSSIGARRKHVSRWPEPVVLFEPMASPMTLNRGGSTGLSFTGGSAAAIPFPLVFIPDYPDSSLGSLCVIQHEVGHNLDEDFGLSDAIEPLLESRLSNLNAQDIDMWVDWLPELIADVVGLILGGVALALELAEWAGVLEDDAALASSTHPFPSVRVVFAMEVLRLMDVKLPAELTELLTKPASELTSEIGRLIDQVPAVAAALMCSPIPGLNHAELRDLGVAAAEDHDRVMSVSKELVAEEIESMPYRLIPSVARVAVSLGEDANAVFNTFKASAKNRSGSDAVRFRKAMFAIESLKDVTPPILAEENARLKRPPANLFRTVEEVSFVGGQNDGLPKLFASYVEEGHPRKRQINVFYLTEHSLSRMAHPGKTAEQLLAGRRASLEALTPAFMDSIAESWQIFEHDEPYFFASYWDATSPGGRIHTSSHGWGQDIKVAPGIDYVWSPNADRPNRKYRWYLESLSELLNRAAIVAASERNS